MVLLASHRYIFGKGSLFVGDIYLKVEMFLLFGELAQAILHKQFLLYALFKHQFLLEFT